MNERRLLVGSLLLLAVTAGLVVAQTTPSRRAPMRDSEEQPATSPLPNDPKLLAAHTEFVRKVEKLATDYERNNQSEKALACYEQILKLVPEYPAAREKVARLKEQEATANRKTMDVFANRGWQDTGIVAIPGKPIRITASGSWTFRLAGDLSPQGMRIPEELRDFDLGALVGVVVGNQKPEDIKPFLVGEAYEFVADQPGRLMLRMYDIDPSDNLGKIQVAIQGTFGK